MCLTPVNTSAIATAEAAATANRLVADLRRLGVATGDVLWVHSSFKSLAPVPGGAATVLSAFDQTLGPRGTLLMPSFNLVSGGYEARAAAWHHDHTPSTVGWLTEFFRRQPGVVRSNHYSHAVSARGRRARWFVSGHRGRAGYRSPWDRAPWGKTFGTHSPFMKLVAMPQSKILMLGVDYHSATFCHLIEVMDWNRRRAADAAAEYYWINRETVGADWDTRPACRRGRLLDQAVCRLFPIAEFVATYRDAVIRQPSRFFKHYPGR